MPAGLYALGIAHPFKPPHRSVCEGTPSEPCLPARPLQVLRKQREKDEELERVRAERDAEAARRSLERKLQLQDKVVVVVVGGERWACVGGRLQVSGGSRGSGDGW